MKTVSIMEAQHNLSRVLRQVESGQSVVITRRKHMIARLEPVNQPVALPDFGVRAAKIWGAKWKGASSNDLLEESRGER